MNTQETKIILDDLSAEVAWRRPDSIIRDTPHWFHVITPSSPVMPLNGVYRSVLSEDIVEETIASTIEDFKKYTPTFRWIVNESSEPASLSQHLEKAKFKRDHLAWGLAHETEKLVQLPKPKNVVIADLTEDKLDEWVEASISSWPNSESFRESLRADVLRALRDESQVLRYMSALIDGKIVGGATLRYCKQCAHLIGSSVRPEYRGRGIYTAMVIKRAEMAALADLKLITVHAIESTSAPILEKMGFGRFSTSVQYSFTE